MTKREKDAQLSESMAKIHELFIKMDEQFKGCTIAGVALDSNSGAVCIHVEEHNKVLMFHATDFSIAEHAGKLSDMLLAAGFVVPEAIMETWNQEFTDMATAYSKAVMAGEDVDPEKVNGERIKLILGPYYNPEEAQTKLAEVGKTGGDVAEGVVKHDAAVEEDEKPEDTRSPELKRYEGLVADLEDLKAEGGGDTPDEEKILDEMHVAWKALSEEEQASFRTIAEEPVEA